MAYCTDTIQTAAKDLRTLDMGRVSYDESLKRHNTWRIGGNASIIVRPAHPLPAGNHELFTLTSDI